MIPQNALGRGHFVLKKNIIVVKYTNLSNWMSNKRTTKQTNQNLQAHKLEFLKWKHEDGSKKCPHVTI